MLEALINRPCTLLLRSTTDETDDYGNETDAETEVETVCEAQPTRIAEPEAAGELSDEDWTAFFLPGDASALTSASAVWIEGLGTFEVVGRPPTLRNPRTQQPAFIQVRMRRTAGPEDEVGS